MFELYKSNIFNLFQNPQNNLLTSLKKRKGSTNKNNITNGESNSSVQPQKEKAKRFVLPEKEFKHRTSLLIELFDSNEHIRIVYNIIISFFIFFIITVLFKEYAYRGRLPRAFSLIISSFGKPHIVLTIWVGNNILTILSYYSFLIWAKVRQNVYIKEIWDILWISALFGYYMMSFYFITYLVFAYNIPFASTMVLSMESVRFLMKIHAFCRSNAPKAINKNSTVPPISKFLYFLYVPTAVYKDVYPRTNTIRWSFIFYRLLEVAAVIVYDAFYVESLGRDLFESTCVTKYSLQELIVLILEFSIPSIILLWGVFFVLLHSSQNAIGELLQFGDRQFYSDWWTCVDVQQFYRKWNLVIGDWLYMYVHKDICEYVSPKKRNFARFFTILLSAAVHEWITTISSGYFLPVVSTCMTISAILCTFGKAEKSIFTSIIAILLMTIGCGCIGSPYALEVSARQNLNVTNYFYPVILTKNCFQI